MEKNEEMKISEEINKMGIDDIAEIVKKSSIYSMYASEVKKGVPKEYTRELLMGLFCLFEESPANKAAIQIVSEKILFSMLDMRFRIEMQKGGENNED